MASSRALNNHSYDIMVRPNVCFIRARKEISPLWCLAAFPSGLSPVPRSLTRSLKDGMASAAARAPEQRNAFVLLKTVAVP